MMPERTIDISRGFNVGREMAAPGALASFGGGLAGGLSERFAAVQQAKQQALLQHTLRMKYDPEYRYNYQVYSRLNDEMAQPAPMSRFGVNPQTGYAEGIDFAPGTQVNYMTPPAGLRLPPQGDQSQGQFLQPTSGQVSGLPTRELLERAALAKLFPILGKRYEAQETEAGRLAALYGNPQEARRLSAQAGGEEARGALARQQSILTAHPWQRRLGTNAPASPFEPTQSQTPVHSQDQIDTYNALRSQGIPMDEARQRAGL